MNAYKITTKNFNKTFVVATSAENAIREFKKLMRCREKDNGFQFYCDAKEITKVKLVGFIGNI